MTFKFNLKWKILPQTYTHVCIYVSVCVCWIWARTSVTSVQRCASCYPRAICCTQPSSSWFNYTPPSCLVLPLFSVPQLYCIGADCAILCVWPTAWLYALASAIPSPPWNNVIASLMCQSGIQMQFSPAPLCATVLTMYSSLQGALCVTLWWLLYYILADCLH